MANTPVYKPQGGAEIVVSSGGKITVESGATIEAKSGAIVTGFGNAPYILPVATADTLGGVKVGTALDIADGVLSVSQAEAVEDCAAEDVDGCVTSINAIIAALKASGLMAAE